MLLALDGYYGCRSRLLWCSIMLATHMVLELSFAREGQLTLRTGMRLLRVGKMTPLMYLAKISVSNDMYECVAYSKIRKSGKCFTASATHVRLEAKVQCLNVVVAVTLTGEAALTAAHCALELLAITM